MDDTTSERNYKTQDDVLETLDIDSDPYNRSEEMANADNTWLKHLLGNADVPLAVKPKKRITKHVSRAQIRALENMREEK